MARSKIQFQPTCVYCGEKIDKLSNIYGITDSDNLNLFFHYQCMKLELEKDKSEDQITIKQVNEIYGSNNNE